MARDGSQSSETMTNRGRLVVGCMKDGDTDYDTTTGIDLSTSDFTPENNMNGLVGTAGAGNVHVVLANGGEMILPFTVSAAASSELFRGYQIKTVKMTTTTFSGYLFPVF